MAIVPVVVHASHVEEGLAAPVLGQEVSWPLSFREVSEDEDPDPELCRWWEVTAAANGEDAGQRRQPLGGPPEGPVFWPTLLHGPGWIASWNASRRVRGPARVRGQLWAANEYAVGPTAHVTGGIARIRVVTEAVTHVRGSRELSPRLLAGSRSYHDVQISPLAFDRGDGFFPASAPHQPLPTSVNPEVLLPPGALVRQLGVLADLELPPT